MIHENVRNWLRNISERRMKEDRASPLPMGPRIVVASKRFSIFVLVLAELAGMSLWFMSAAMLPEMAREAAISTFRQALLSSGVQAGFVVGAVVFAFVGISERFRAACLRFPRSLLLPIFLAFVKLVAIRLWIRVNESTP